MVAAVSVLTLAVRWDYVTTAAEFGDPDPEEPPRLVRAAIFPGLIDEDYARTIFGDRFDEAIQRGVLVREPS